MNPYLMTPRIIKESSEGTTYCPIQDELFSRHRSIEVVGVPYTPFDRHIERVV